MANTLTGVCITEGEEIVYCNERFAQMLGYSRVGLLGRDISQVFGSCLDHRAEGGLHSSEVAPSPSTVEIAAVKKDGQHVLTRQSITQLLINDVPHTVRNVIDLTEQKAAENTLENSQTKLHALSQELLKVQERERKRIASELHDGIGQNLSSIKFALENVLRQPLGGLQGRTLTTLTALVSRIRDTIEEVRKISMDLRPPMLDDIGIVATINWLCREFQSVHPSLRIYKEVNLQESDVAGMLKAVIFRILQESLNNIAKHANATQVRVYLKSTGGDIRLGVEDNGCGFSIRNENGLYGGFGLYSMRERAELSGGRLQIYSNPALGTRIRAHWPTRF